MKLIGTHDSATGEPGEGFLSWLLTPFARTQSKTIREQYEAGARYFDLRIRIDDGFWVLAHGPWKSSTTPREIFDFLNQAGGAVVSIMYEGELNYSENFLDYCDTMTKLYPNIMFHKVKVKKPVERTLKTYRTVPYRAGYIGFNFEHWQILLLTPWAVNFFCTREHKFDEESYNLVDFL